YANPNASTVEPVEKIFPSLAGQLVSFYSAAGTAYGLAGDNLLVGRYIQYWGTYSTSYSPLSTTAADQSNYDEMGGTVGSSDNLGSVWAMHYYGMGQNLNRVVEWGSEQQKWDFVGAAWALRAWTMLEVTDEYNEMILRDAFNSSLQQFTYQGQDEVYDSVRTICFRALDYLNRTDGNVSPGNFAASDAYLNGGSIDKWKKLVYGVLARSYAYLTDKTDYSADSVIKYASLSCVSNADNITQKFAALGSSGTTNYYGTLRGNVGSIRQSQYVADLMSGNNPGAFTGVVDPRTWYMLREDSNATFKGITPWSGSSGLATRDQPQNFWGNPYSSTTAGNTPRYIFRDNSEFPVMTASEMQFLLAEAYLRKGDATDALTAYTNGISLNFDMLSTNYGTNIPAGDEITPGTVSDYLANPAIVPTLASSLTLTMIMLQKYIALYGWGVQETWVDMRRYHYTDTDPATGDQVYVNFQTPLAAGSLFANNNGKLVYRARMRYNSEYLYDIPSLMAIGAVSDLMGTQVLDYHTKPTWFSQP
ncbi:MAG TPA: SusD/RagB family nutrient-binding outer membrane lipoprotein, partial [Chitinophagaceae bacterium]